MSTTALILAAAILTFILLAAYALARRTAGTQRTTHAVLAVAAGTALGWLIVTLIDAV